MKRAAEVLTFLAVIIFLLAPLQAAAGEPTDQVKSTIDKVITVLKDPSLKGPAKTVERRDKLRTAIQDLFNFREMAKRSLGKHWRARSGEEREEFSHLFGRLIENSYIDKLEKYTDEEVIYADERTVKNKAIVKTRIITKKGTEIPIDYKLVNKGKWMVYDVVIEGVSLVRNYRTQFASVLKSSPYIELVSQLKAKTQDSE